MIVGNTNPSTLATNIAFLYHPLPQIKIESKVQTGAFPYVSNVLRCSGLLEYLGKSSTISLALYKPKSESGRMTIGYLQSISKNFCAGVELLMALNAQNQMQANVALAGRWVRSIAFVSSKLKKNPKNTFELQQFRNFLLLRSRSFHFHVCVINFIQNCSFAVCWKIRRTFFTSNLVSIPFSQHARFHPFADIHLKTALWRQPCQRTH